MIYELVGPVFVGVDRGPDPAAPLAGSAAASLTIDAGVTVVGEGNDDYLVIARGSRLLSNGTEAQPVVFTAKTVVDGTIAALDQDTKGVWVGSSSTVALRSMPVTRPLRRAARLIVKSQAKVPPACSVVQLPTMTPVRSSTPAFSMLVHA